MAKPFKSAIFGNGLSGQSVAKLVQSLGGESTIFDDDLDCDPNLSNLDEFDSYIFSPGFAADHRWRVAAAELDGAVFGELGFAASHWGGALIGVTGTNGKTTVTSLLASALVADEQAACVAGNIGIPLSDRVFEFRNEDNTAVTAVCEISSFQAELPAGLRLDGLLWTNFAEDHLDRYVNMADYFESKVRLIDCLKPGAPCIIGSSVASQLDSVRLARCHVVADVQVAEIELHQNSIFAHSPQSENLALIDSFCKVWPIARDNLSMAVNQFSQAPHRLSLICEVGHVRFWDDSKATNFHATLAAVSSFREPVIWIGGGLAKGGDLAGFAREISLHIESAVLYGDVAQEMGDFLKVEGNMPQIYEHFGDAIDAAWKLAFQHNSTFGQVSVVLSPGFASFDQFSGYAERGKTFMKSVLSLKESDGGK